MTDHQLEPAPETTADVFSRERAPVLTVDPGDTVVVRSLDASGHLARQQSPGEQTPVMFSARRGHCLTGPIAVRGAVPGDVLAVRLVSLRPADWGWTVAAARDTPLTRRLGLHEGPPSWLLWDIDVAAGTATNNYGHTVRIAPFLGVTGVAWDEPGEHSTIPPRAAGGGNHAPLAGQGGQQAGRPGCRRRSSRPGRSCRPPGRGSAALRHHRRWPGPRRRGPAIVAAASAGTAATGWGP